MNDTYDYSDLYFPMYYIHDYSDSTLSAGGTAQGESEFNDRIEDQSSYSFDTVILSDDQIIVLNDIRDRLDCLVLITICIFGIFIIRSVFNIFKG